MKEHKTIVVADDEVDITSAIQEILEKNGYSVLVTNDGKTAIETIIRVKPDLAVLDILMPEVQGFDVCRYLRGQWELKGMKILILSSMASEFDLETARAAGADSYITKPFSPEGLLNEIRQLLDSE